MSDGGKGSAMRPTQVSKENFSNNWDTIFAKKETVKVESFKEVSDTTVPKSDQDPLRSGCSAYGAAAVSSKHGMSLSHEDNGKISEIRRTLASKEKFANNWDTIFAKKKTIVVEPIPSVRFECFDKPFKEVGDIVVPKPGLASLRSGGSEYGAAVVVSVEPFVMVSEFADMRWSTHEAKNYLVAGRAGTTLLTRCMTRL